MRQIVGLGGDKGAGKDTAAKVLTAAGWLRTAFADALYQEVADAFGVTVEFLQIRETKETPQPQLALQRCREMRFVGRMLALFPEKTQQEFLEKHRSPREILQYWGTEYRRELFSDRYWLEIVDALILAHPDKNIVITDVRNPNEITFVRGYGGTYDRVVCPELSHAPKTQTDMHSSETALQDVPADHYLINSHAPGGKEALWEQIRALYLQEAPALPIAA